MSEAPIRVTETPEDFPLKIKFMMITFIIIQQNLPNKYWNTSEWEYDIDTQNNDAPLFLHVWRTPTRKDIPKKIEITGEPEKVLKKIMYDLITKNIPIKK